MENNKEQQCEFWYRAVPQFGQIEKVEVESTTASFIKIKGSNFKTAKKSSYDQYVRTFEEAKQLIVDYQNEVVTNLEKQLNEAKAKLEKYKTLSK